MAGLTQPRDGRRRRVGGNRRTGVCDPHDHPARLNFWVQRMINRHLPPRVELKSFWEQAADSISCPVRCKPNCDCPRCTALAELRKLEAAGRIARNQSRPARRLKTYYP